jgi:hypothetical protein
MPRGPKGEKRLADVVGNAVHVMRIATGEIDESTPPDDGKDHWERATAHTSRASPGSMPFAIRTSSGSLTICSASGRSWSTTF